MGELAFKMKLFVLAALACFGFISANDSSLPCAPVEYNKGIACVCNETYCDTVSSPRKEDCDKWNVYSTSEDGDRFKLTLNPVGDACPFADASYDIDPEIKHQKILGFGGAMTDAVGINIDSLTEPAQEKLLESYFGKDGIEYSMIRVPIAGCDYSKRKYTYDDTEKGIPDPFLYKFKLSEEDSKYKIPYIQKAQTKSKVNIKLLASPWDFPDWMGMENFLKKSVINPIYYHSWARYFEKFFDEYKKRNITYWAMTTANEPETAAVSKRWDLPQHQHWLQKHLCPVLRNSQHKDMKVYIMDDQVPYLGTWGQSLIDNRTYECVEGVATHWYLDQFLVGMLQNSFCSEFPEKSLISSESSICEYEPDFHYTTSWDRAERYAGNILMKLLNCIQAYIDWNLVLDLIGGPNYVNNYCDAPVRVNKTANEFYKQPMFYILGHFSKFIPPDSVRIEVSSTNAPRQITTAAFTTPEAGTVFIAFNEGKKDYKVNVCKRQKDCSRLNIKGKSIVTAVLSKCSNGNAN